MSTLNGARVYPRPFEPEDAKPLYESLNHPDLIGCRYLPNGFSEELPLSYAQVNAILANWSETDNCAHLAVVQRETETLVGRVSAYWGWDTHCPNMEVVIFPEHQRKGFGSEALALFIQWVFDTIPAHNIGMDAASWNEPAQNFLLKMGFQRAGRFRREGMRDGKFYDLVLFDLLRREWRMIP